LQRKPATESEKRIYRVEAANNFEDTVFEVPLQIISARDKSKTFSIFWFEFRCVGGSEFTWQM